MDAIFELKDISYSYLKRFPALDGISLNILPGQKVLFIGANGSGKSTLLQMLDGLIFPDSGSIKVFGTELNKKSFESEEFSSSFRKKIGFVFQNPEVQLFCPTVREDIVFGPLNFGMPAKEIKKNFDRIVDILKIEKLIDRSPHQLSFGEKRKAALASVLIFSPEVLILDEQTAGLDPRTTRELMDLLIDYHKNGKTVITATHDLHTSYEIADFVYVMGKEKKIIRSGTPEDILKDKEFLLNNNLSHIHNKPHSHL